VEEEEKAVKKAEAEEEEFWVNKMALYGEGETY
jgi:hypothetical protein